VLSLLQRRGERGEAKFECPLNTLFGAVELDSGQLSSRDANPNVWFALCEVQRRGDLEAASNSRCGVEPGSEGREPGRGVGNRVCEADASDNVPAAWEGLRLRF
jgi:hypothetical protein